MISDEARRTFDRLLERQIDSLPEDLHELLEEVPLIVEDMPTDAVLRDLGIGERGRVSLCGLHSGVALPDRSVEAPPRVPDRMMLFREPIMRVAGYPPRAVRPVSRGRVDELERQVRITLLHEMGHHFGLDEDDLAELGYA